VGVLGWVIHVMSVSCWRLFIPRIVMLDTPLSSIRLTEQHKSWLAREAISAVEPSLTNLGRYDVTGEDSEKREKEVCRRTYESEFFS
jgi:hypothetical protein